MLSEFKTGCADSQRAPYYLLFQKEIPWYFHVLFSCPFSSQTIRPSEKKKIQKLQQQCEHLFPSCHFSASYLLSKSPAWCGATVRRSCPTCLYPRGEWKAQERALGSTDHPASARRHLWERGRSARSERSERSEKSVGNPHRRGLRKSRVNN